jgi:hypothetical protein
MSLRDNITGAKNVAMGENALMLNTNSNNTAIGFEALKNNTGARNTAVGTNALLANTTGDFNTAIGEQSLFTNTTGRRNVAIGKSSLLNNTMGQHNISIGFESSRSNTIGNENIAIGFTALSSVDGSSNIAIGTFAGSNYVSTETNNIVIGNTGTAGDGAAGATGVIRIGTSTQQAVFILPTLIKQTTAITPPTPHTLLASDLIGPAGGFLFAAVNLAYTWTMPTSADIVTALGGNIDVGNSFEFKVACVVGASITMVGGDVVIQSDPDVLTPSRTFTMIYDGTIWNMY